MIETPAYSVGVFICECEKSYEVIRFLLLYVLQDDPNGSSLKPRLNSVSLKSAAPDNLRGFLFGWQKCLKLRNWNSSTANSKQLTRKTFCDGPLRNIVTK